MDLGPGNEEQLNASSAARKLVAAAAVHGADTVVRYANEFASHGLGPREADRVEMIEEKKAGQRKPGPESR